MPRVVVEPSGVQFQGASGESVLEAAERSGYFWPVGCSRNGECTNCAFEVISGLGRLTSMGRYERANLRRQRGPTSTQDPRLRLACQARLSVGDVVVYKRGVRLSEFP